MFTRFLKTSRPRFWLYTLGPFILPLIVLLPGMVREWPILFIGFFYFSFPANLLIYGINDIFDQETDARNAKKEGYEVRLQKKDICSLLLTICITNVPFLVALAVLAPRSIPALLGFLFFSIFYSAPPIRAKAIPFFDGLFNVLYVFPGLVAVLLFPYAHINWTFVVAGTLWCMAMHAFSAIPDIEADTSAHLNTIATLFGARTTTYYCGILWILSAVLAVMAPHGFSAWFICLLLLPYLYLLVKSSRAHAVLNVYRVFPYVNACIGTGITLYLLRSMLA